jgi:hypothetical protein
VMDVSSPAEPLNVAVLALVGIPALQLPAVPQRLEDLVVHVSTWARAIPADRHKALPARIIRNRA